MNSMSGFDLFWALEYASTCCVSAPAVPVPEKRPPRRIDQKPPHYCQWEGDHDLIRLTLQPCSIYLDATFQSARTRWFALAEVASGLVWPAVAVDGFLLCTATLIADSVKFSQPVR